MIIWRSNQPLASMLTNERNGLHNRSHACEKAPWTLHEDPEMYYICSANIKPYFDTPSVYLDQHLQ